MMFSILIRTLSTRLLASRNISEQDIRASQTTEYTGSSDVALSEASLLYQARELNRDRNALSVPCLQATPYFSEHP
jgi:hypothetical protein